MSQTLNFILIANISLTWVHSGLMVSMLDCQSRGRGSNLSPGLEISAPLANSAIMSRLTVHCHWEDEMVRERTGHPPHLPWLRKMPG